MKDIDSSLSEGPLNLLHYVVLGRKEVIAKVVLTSDSLYTFISVYQLNLPQWRSFQWAAPSYMSYT